MLESPVVDEDCEKMALDNELRKQSRDWRQKFQEVFDANWIGVQQNCPWKLNGMNEAFSKVRLEY